MSGGLSLPSLYNDKGDERVPYWERFIDEEEAEDGAPA
jgi:hypothetical protein